MVQMMGDRYNGVSFAEISKIFVIHNSFLQNDLSWQSIAPLVPLAAATASCSPLCGWIYTVELCVVCAWVDILCDTRGRYTRRHGKCTALYVYTLLACLVIICLRSSMLNTPTTKFFQIMPRKQGCSSLAFYHIICLESNKPTWKCLECNGMLIRSESHVGEFTVPIWKSLERDGMQ